MCRYFIFVTAALVDSSRTCSESLYFVALLFAAAMIGFGIVSGSCNR